ncbi:MAG: flagellar motor stator protein MotA [Clostridiales bacterium]|jgi:chemotaxis protein MotA|nr:flagellar motor stator protein MotA [Clostridiales bacterium]
MTLIGLIVGLAAVLIGMVFKGVPLSALANPAAFFIILIGTAGAVIIATPGNEIKNIGRLFGVLFGKSRFTSNREVVTTIVELSEIVRRDGILALEEKADSIGHPFIVQGIQMLTEGADTHQISELLSAEIGAMEDRHAANAQIFTQAGTYAPTLGVLGAVLGLIAALSNMNDTEALGHAISAAFVATLLGIFTGYVLWHPFANRLKRKSKQEAFVKGLMLEGLLGISEGQNPRALKDRLLLFLPEKARGDFAEEKTE